MLMVLCMITSIRIQNFINEVLYSLGEFTVKESSNHHMMTDVVDERENGCQQLLKYIPMDERYRFEVICLWA